MGQGLIAPYCDHCKRDHRHGDYYCRNCGVRVDPLDRGLLVAPITGMFGVAFLFQAFGGSSTITALGALLGIGCGIWVNVRDGRKGA